MGGARSPPSSQSIEPPDAAVVLPVAMLAPQPPKRPAPADDRAAMRAALEPMPDEQGDHDHRDRGHERSRGMIQEREGALPGVGKPHPALMSVSRDGALRRSTA